MEYFVLILVVGVVLGVLLRLAGKRRCPYCHRLRAMECVDRRIGSRSAIAKNRNRRVKDKQGNIIRTARQRVDGVRVVWVESWQCRYCGKTVEKDAVEENYFE